MLASLGYSISVDLPASETCHRYLTLQRRLVSSRPRPIFKAMEFTCPPELNAGLAALERKINGGEDLRPHLSRRLADLDIQDMLHNDWGIHHLHLGIKQESDGFVERTGPVLFARFSSTAAYLISVRKHGSWACQDFIRVIHRNWPETISRYRLLGAVSLAKQTSDEDIAMLRKAAINVPIQVEPRAIYMAIGGGYSTTKTNAKVVRDCARQTAKLKACEEFVREKAPAVLEQAQARGLKIGDELSFKLRTLDGVLVALEENTGTVLPLPDGGA